MTRDPLLPLLALAIGLASNVPPAEARKTNPVKVTCEEFLGLSEDVQPRAEDAALVDGDVARLLGVAPARLLGIARARPAPGESRPVDGGRGDGERGPVRAKEGETEVVDRDQSRQEDVDGSGAGA